MIPRRKVTDSDDEVPVFTRRPRKPRPGDTDFDPLRPNKRRLKCADPTPEEEQVVSAACRKRMEECFGPGAGKFRIYVKTIPKAYKGEAVPLE